VLALFRRLPIAICCILALSGANASQAAASPRWYAFLGPTGSPFALGPAQLYVDDEIDQPTGRHFVVPPETSGYLTTFYLVESDTWVGQTGFYSRVVQPLLAPMETRIWDGMYAWAQGQGVPGGLVRHFWSPGGYWPPTGYTAQLVLDYVPPDLSYDGPVVFDFGAESRYFELPVPNVTDPLQGTRMHIAVTAPVPEPSSLLALSAGLAGLVGALRRRPAAG